jgi:uncharacterized protein
MRAAIRLAASLRHRNDWHSSPRLRAVRYLLKTFIAPRAHADWLALLADTAMRTAVARDTHLFERWQHRWVSRRFGYADRVARVIDHHRATLHMLPAIQRERLWADERIATPGVTAKGGETLQAFLSAPIKRCLEGELVVGLAFRGAPVFSMTVTVCPATNETLVGCIQGPRSESGLADVRELTRLCHGLRPKDFLLSLVRVVAAAGHTRTIRGPGNAMHVFGHTSRLQANYDGFWEEAGATLGADGLYSVPAAEPIRAVGDVPSKHRSAFRAREALRLALCNQLGHLFGLPEVLAPVLPMAPAAVASDGFIDALEVA